MEFSMDDNTFHFSEQENDECSLNTSFLDELNVPTEESKANDAAAAAASAKSNTILDESSHLGNLVECEQQDNFPFIKGTEPSEKAKAMLHKCQAYAYFYEMPSVMHSLKQPTENTGHAKAWTPCWQPILRTVAVVGPTKLLLGDGQSWSTASLGSALTSGGQNTSPVKHVLVHHELEPHIRRYLALLQEDHTLTVLSFPQLQVVSRFSSVGRVTSADERGDGLPSLLVIKRSGERVRWSPLYSDAEDAGAEQPPTPPAKLQVAKILQSKLHAAYDRLQRLESSSRLREAFISRHTAILRHVLAGGSGAGGLALPLAQTAVASAGTSDSLCRITSVRCKVLHGRSLLVCAAITNCSSRLLLSDMELVLNLQSDRNEHTTSSGKIDHPHLEYKSYVYKSVMRVPKPKPSAVAASRTRDEDGSRSHIGSDESISNVSTHKEPDTSSGASVRAGGGGCKSGTHIELLSPCLLRPNKQAYVIGVCLMPVFSSSRYLNVTGLIRFKTKPLALQDKKSHIPSPKVAIVSSNAGVKIGEFSVKSPLVKSDYIASKRKEFGSSGLTSCNKEASPALCPKKGNVSVVEDFLCRHGGVFVKCQYPQYANDSADCSYQVPIKTISLDALKMDAIKVSFTLPPPKAGVSLDSLALIAGSEHCRVLLQSHVCGLSTERLLAQLAQRCDIKRVADVHNVHVLYAADSSASLHLCAFSLTQETQRCVSADLYFRDVRQGLLLVHTLKAALPFDAVISPVAATAKAALPSERSAGVFADEDPVKLLYEKMRKVSKFLSKGVQDRFDLRADRQEQAKKKSKFEEESKSGNEAQSAAEMYDERRKLFLESEDEFIVDRLIYAEWKSELITLIEELDEAYVEAHASEQ